MCLAIPMKLVEAREHTGVVESRGVLLRVGLQLVPDAQVGDYVLVHAGFALTILTESEARETESLLDDAGELRS